MSTRENPFEEMKRLIDRMSRQFDEVSGMWESDDAFAQWSSETESMTMDLVDHDDEFVVTVDLPGYEREDVEIEITDHTLRIEAERGEEVDTEDGQYLRHERRHKSTQRSVRLPDEVDKEAVSARMKNGVLSITIPKAEAEKARKIEIKDE